MIRTAIGVALVATAGTAFAGSSIFAESFENAPGTTYTLSSEFDDGSFDFFGRYAVPDGSNAARDDFVNGWDGMWGIIGQDHDAEGGAATQVVTIGGIDIAGFSDLAMTASFGALASEAAGFDNYEADDGDGIRVYATIDGGMRALIAEFAPPAESANMTANSGDLRLDTDGDGVGDGPVLTADLADFSFNIAGTGSSLTLEIEMTSTSSFEPLALDNVRVSGIPTPGAIAVAGLGGLVAARRRRA